MPTPQDIKHQRDLLNAHRRTLGVLLKQRGQLGLYAPPGVHAGIDDAHAGVRSAKNQLRAWGETSRTLLAMRLMTMPQAGH